MLKNLYVGATVLGLGLTGLTNARADYAPIALTPQSYNQDGVVELAVPHVTQFATTATLDAGTNNNNFTWYEQGYNTANPSTGLPTAGSTFTSQSQADHNYQMAPSYVGNDAVLINSQVTSATLTPSASAAYSSLSFLASSGNGTVTINYTVHHADGTTDTGSFDSPDWFGAGTVAYVPLGRVDAQNRSFQTWTSTDPEIFSMDVALTHTTSPITSIALSYGSGSGNACVLAVSGSTGSTFNPIAVTGYNEDMVVEASAQQAPALNGAYTTVSMDNGLANTGFGWYEQGFVYTSPNTGVPLAGSTITNQAASDHTYKMPTSYAGSDVIYIDAATPATITPATPVAYSALSFLGAAGHGPLIVDYSVSHTDGSTETGTITVPDWFGTGTKAWSASGRIDVGNSSVQTWGSGGPALFSMDIALTDTASPVTGVTLTYDAGNNGSGDVMLLAVSGAAGAVRPAVTVQPVAANSYVPGTNVQFNVTATGTAPLSYQWQKVVGTNVSNLANGGDYSGVTTSNLTISPVSANDGAQYQVVISNSGGSVTSAPALLNLLSTMQDVTAPGDTISVYNGGQGSGSEGVTSAIDDTTQKYLNVSSSGSTYQGPVGLIVTPALGSTLVKGLRIYTANDAPERDPADFVLEGSNDGTNFSVIASGKLALPNDRNASGSATDPFAQFNQEVDFANSTPYLTYRLSFPHVKNGTGNNLMQVGEVELLGTAGVAVTIQRTSGGQLQLQWAQGLLLESTNILGPWTTNSTATSPYSVSPTGPRKFYRILVQ